MIDQITAFRRMEVEIQLKVSQLSHLKLDGSNFDAVKHLKGSVTSSSCFETVDVCLCPSLI